ncbi:hypothetical protein QTH97_06690 [Variovorax sp. J22R24]|uniref:hypothetical protein n=1 Tax=Variovorax gracilis TaxID=3053502 RepID=UPI00257886CD|nr:hypothetical protein [Variovorax sp. J22R24]MDM0104610.1 hypothetical protein [Variovorax sp. J22R24]
MTGSWVQGSEGPDAMAPAASLCRRSNSAGDADFQLCFKENALTSRHFPAFATQEVPLPGPVPPRAAEKRDIERRASAYNHGDPVAPGGSMMEGMGWLGVWLVFGMLAAQEISGLSTQPASDPALVVFYGVAGLFGLGMMVRRAVRRRHPAHLYAPLALSMAGLAVVALLMYEGKVPPEWINTLVAVAGFLAFSACAASAGAVIAWRRREADRDRRSRETQAWERRRLLERTSSGPIQQFIAELENPPVEDDADLLPPRPPKR